MLGFEPRTSGIRSNPSTNRATATARHFIIFSFVFQSRVDEVKKKKAEVEFVLNSGKKNQVQDKTPSQNFFSFKCLLPSSFPILSSFKCMCVYLYLVTFFPLSHLNLFACLIKLQIAICSIAPNLPSISNALAGGPEKDTLSYSAFSSCQCNECIS